MRTLSALLLLTILSASPPDAMAKPGGERASVEAAVARLAAGRDLTVRWRDAGARPAVIKGLSEATSGETAVARAAGFLGAHPGLFLPREQLRAGEVRAVLRKGLSTEGPAIMEFIVSREENVYPMVPAGKPIDSIMEGP